MQKKMVGLSITLVAIGFVLIGFNELEKFFKISYTQGFYIVISLGVVINFILGLAREKIALQWKLKNKEDLFFGFLVPGIMLACLLQVCVAYDSGRSVNLISMVYLFSTCLLVAILWIAGYFGGYKTALDNNHTQTEEM